MNKTNVMRLLDAAGIDYTPLTYEVDEQDLSGVHAAALLGRPPEQLFKTLVLKGERVGYFVCCIPCSEELDLKKAAKAAGDKKAELLPMKQLLGITGYVRGGCSPIGMKKKFPTFIDETCVLHERIAVSAGMRGAMILLSPEALTAYVEATPCELV